MHVVKSNYHPPTPPTPPSNPAPGRRMLATSPLLQAGHSKTYFQEILAIGETSKNTDTL